jgi:predicted MFS family arabinose efflux permease
MEASRRAWAVLVGGWLVSVGYSAFVIAPSSVLPLLADAFAVDKPTAGLAISAVYVSWVLAQVPAGFVMDRRDNRRLVVLGVAVYLVGTTAGFLAQSYLLLLATRVFAGVAAAFTWTANANVVGQSFPASSRALATSLFVTSAPAGFALAQFAGPRLAALAGWRAFFLVYPLVTLAGLPLFLWAASPVRTGTPISARDFLATLRNPAVLFVSLSSFCAYSLFIFFNSWMPAYATEQLSTDLAAAGAATALVSVSGVLARPVGGWLADGVGSRRSVIVAALVCSVPTLAALSLVGSPLAFAAVLLLAGFFSQLGVGVYYVFVGELTADDAVGTSLAVLTTLSIAGSLVTPVVAGWLIDAVSWSAAFAYALLLAVLGAAFVAFVPAETA